MSQNNGYRNRLVNGRGFDRDLEYVHQEYPKIVQTPDGDRVTVESEKEEKELLAAFAEDEETPDKGGKGNKKTNGGKNKPDENNPDSLE